MSAATNDVAEQLAKDVVKARRRAITDPAWFAREMLNLKALPGEPGLKDNANRSWELDGWTVNLLDAVGDVIRKQKGLPTRINHKGLNQISVRSMHGPGKTFGLATLMHWFAFCFNAKIPCIAPKIGQLKTRLWSEFRKIRNRARPGYRDLMRIHAETIKWIGRDGQYEDGPIAFMETASSPENLAGLHHDYMLVVVDEASGVDEKLWPTIEGAISTGVIVIMVIISNPTRLQGTFADSHLKPAVAQDWFQLHIRLQDTARVSREWVAKMERKYGKDSPVVQVRCYGEFAAEDRDQIISMQWIEDGRNRPFVDDGSIPRQRISIDAADGGDNFSVLTHGVHFESFLRLKKQTQHSFPGGQAATMLADAAEAMWKANDMNADNGDDIVVDSLGVGAGVCAILIERGYPVIRYMGGSRSDDAELYRNRRVQSYLVCRDYFRDGQIVIDDDFVEMDEWDDVIAQLCSIRRNPNTEKLEDLMTKQEMINKKLISPDRADSIAMQFATQSPERAVGSSDFVVIPGIAESSHAGIT